MALLAIGSKLAAVDIGMAVRAAGAHVGENRLGMAVGAADALMKTTQREFCRVVIEFRDSPYRLPPQRGMAVLTGNVQISVRTARLCVRLRLPVQRKCGQQSQPTNELPCERRNHRSPHYGNGSTTG